MKTINSGVIDWDLVSEEESDDDIKNNAKYAITVARMLGSPVFILWE